MAYNWRNWHKINLDYNNLRLHIVILFNKMWNNDLISMHTIQTTLEDIQKWWGIIKEYLLQLQSIWFHKFCNQIQYFFYSNFKVNFFQIYSKNRIDLLWIVIVDTPHSVWLHAPGVHFYPEMLYIILKFLLGANRIVLVSDFRFKKLVFGWKLSKNDKK